LIRGVFNFALLKDAQFLSLAVTSINLDNLKVFGTNHPDNLCD